MTKTLDDLTPQERDDYVGAWVNVPHNPRPVIYMRDFYSTGEIKHGAIFLDPLYGDNHARLEDCVTRPDLPRAWAPEGQPVPGEWEDGHVVVSYDDPDSGILKDAVSIEGLSEGGMSYYDAPPNGIEVKLDKFGEGEGKARRWVGDWEPA